MKFALLLLAVVACKKSPAPAAGPEEAATERPAELPPPGSQHAPPEGAETRPPPDVAALQGLARRLSIRDPEPECQELADSLEVDPRPTFLYVVNTVENPPWSAMRAAGCVIELYPQESADTIVSWVRNPETQGLGRLVLSKLDTLPETLAMDVVKVGLKADLAEATKEAAAESGSEAIQALVAAPDPEPEARPE